MNTRLTVGLAILCALIALLLFTLPEPERPAETNNDSANSTTPLQPIEEILDTPPEPLSITDPKLLQEYGSTSSTPIDDLERVDNVLQRFWLLYKNPDLLRVGSNEEIVESLTGSNPDGIAFISPDNTFIDSQGRLLDRWGAPLFFHAQSLTHIEIRSAGPDKELFTDDDVHTVSRSSIRPR